MYQMSIRSLVQHVYKSNYALLIISLKITMSVRRKNLKGGVNFFLGAFLVKY